MKEAGRNDGREGKTVSKKKGKKEGRQEASVTYESGQNGKSPARKGKVRVLPKSEKAHVLPKPEKAARMPIRSRRMQEERKQTQDNAHTLVVEGRNAVLEAFRSGKPIDKVFVLDGCQDGPVRTIIREARKHDVIISFVSRERLNQLSETGKHQGVIAYAAAYEYSEVEDMLKLAEERGEDPFLILLDNIEDPHNLGAIIRTANLAGAHGVIIPKRRAVGLTATVAKTSAGALNYTPVAKVTNLVKTMEELKQRGLWFVCADMDGDLMYDLNLTGPIGLVVGSEGEGVGRLVKENCDFVAGVPMRGQISSLNASVAAGVLAYEIVRQRLGRG